MSKTPIDVIYARAQSKKEKMRYRFGRINILVLLQLNMEWSGLRRCYRLNVCVSPKL